ncbi:hypothetical protein V1507DRAFT_500368 [Lipomyces tetrasporus]
MDPPMRPRRKQAVDYLLLNDGYEGDVLMENIVPDTAQSSIESSITSQSSPTALSEEVYDLESAPVRTDSNSSRRTRGTSNYWLWEQFEIRTLRYDQLITCKHCQKWSIKDSARSTSTTNLSYHLQKCHGLPLGNDRESSTQPTIMTIWKRKETANTAESFERISFVGSC